MVEDRCRGIEWFPGIPGNRKVFGRLRERLRSDGCVGLVGAGASAGLYPLWSELLRLLVDEAEDAG